MSKAELRSMGETMVNVPFSEAEVLTLQCAATLMDGRGALAKLLRKRITPVALGLIEQHKAQARQLLEQHKAQSTQGGT